MCNTEFAKKLNKIKEHLFEVPPLKKYSMRIIRIYCTVGYFMPLTNNFQSITKKIDLLFFIFMKKGPGIFDKSPLLKIAGGTFECSLKNFETNVTFGVNIIHMFIIVIF